MWNQLGPKARDLDVQCPEKQLLEPARSALLGEKSDSQVSLRIHRIFAGINRASLGICGLFVGIEKAYCTFAILEVLCKYTQFRVSYAYLRIP